MTPPSPAWTLTIASDLHLLMLVRAFMEGVCQACDFAETATHAVVLAVNEAADNIIRHAHDGQPGAWIRIHCQLRGDGIEICFHDEGKPFDICTVPALDPAELRVGGRGVYLMRRLMDELSCERRGERGNVLRMVKRCERNSSDRPGR